MSRPRSGFCKAAPTQPFGLETSEEATPKDVRILSIALQVARAVRVRETPHPTAQEHLAPLHGPLHDICDPEPRRDVLERKPRFTTRQPGGIESVIAQNEEIGLQPEQLFTAALGVHRGRPIRIPQASLQRLHPPIDGSQESEIVIEGCTRPPHVQGRLELMMEVARGLDQTERRMAHSAECYFDRAIRWAPQDPNVHMIYGYYQNKVGHPDAAIQSYQTALSLAYDNAEAHYNIGLLYADLKDYPNSRKHAKIAYDLGFPLPGLMRKLQRAGEWQAAETRSSPATQAVESSAPKN